MPANGMPAGDCFPMPGTIPHQGAACQRDSLSLARTNVAFFLYHIQAETRSLSVLRHVHSSVISMGNKEGS